MYPEESYNYKPQPSQPNGQARKVAAIALAAVLLATIGLIIYAVLRQSGPIASDANIADPGYKLNPTSLKSNQNFASMQGNGLYGFNGLSFYKYDLSNGQLSILNRGLKLPTPDTITWGENGALLTFKESFVGSRVDDLLSASGQPLDQDSQAYIWYLNFSSGELSVANTLPLTKDSAIYSKTAGGFYYTTEPASRAPTNNQPLFFYDIRTKQSTQLVQDTSLSGTNAMSSCSSFKLCLAGRTNKDVRTTAILGLTTDNKLQTITSFEGRAFATNQPDQFVTVAVSDEVKDASTPASGAKKQNEFDTDYSPATAKVFNAKDKTSQSLNFTVANNDLYAHFNNDGTYYAFDSDYNASEPRTTSVDNFKAAYRAGEGAFSGASQSKLFPLIRTDNKAYDDRVFDASFGNDATLVTGATQTQSLFSKQDLQGKLAARDIKKVTAAANACKPKSDSQSAVEYLSEDDSLRISLSMSNAFTANLAATTDCIMKQAGTDAMGTNFKIFGVDPTNGKYVTD